MTDKVQKILSEIATRKLCTMDEHMAFYNDKAKEDYRFLSEIEELIKALQEEPVSEDLEKAARKYAGIPEDSPHDLKYCVQDKKAKYDAVLYGANLQQQMMAKAVDGDVTFDYYNNDKIYGCIAHDSFCLEDFGLKDGDKVKVILIKEE